MQQTQLLWELNREFRPQTSSHVNWMFQSSIALLCTPYTQNRQRQKRPSWLFLATFSCFTQRVQFCRIGDELSYYILLPFAWGSAGFLLFIIFFLELFSFVTLEYFAWLHLSQPCSSYVAVFVLLLMLTVKQIWLKLLTQIYQVWVNIPVRKGSRSPR